MSKIVWDKTGERFYETGVSKGVLYPQVSASYPKGVAWNGLTAVTESPSGAEATPLYADNIKYLNLMSTEEFGATIEAYTYPDEFAKCDGSEALATGVNIGQQNRQQFGLSYQTILGNDVASNDYGYKLHIIYGAMASPSEKAYATVNDSPEAITFSWEVTTTPVNVEGFKPTATVVIDSSTADKGKLAELETILYGTDPTLLQTEPEDWTEGYANYLELVEGEYVPVTGSGAAPSFATNKYYKKGDEPRLPLPDEIAEIFNEGE